MNKQMIVIAVASAMASPLAVQAADFQVGAATNVNISGLLAVGAKNSKVTNSNRNVAAENRLDDNTSRLIISSSSEIGSGWRVIFRMESRFQADVRPGTTLGPGPGYNALSTGQATGWADGDTWGGIAGPYGSLTFGKSTLYYTDTISMPYLGMSAPGEGYRIWDDNGLGTFNMLDQVNALTKAGVGAASMFTLGNTRSQNVLRYTSVNYHGVQFGLAYSKNTDGDELHAPDTYATVPTYSRNYQNGGTSYANVTYNDATWSASASYVNKRIEGGTYTPGTFAGPQDLQAVRLGVSYMTPIKLKVGVVWDSTTVDNAILTTTQSAKRSVVEIPISYTLGDHAFYVTYNKAGNTSSYDKTGASQVNLGWDYALTKRAFVGLFFTELNNQQNAHYTPFLSNTTFGPTAPNTGQNWHQLGVNLNYWF